MIADDLAPEIGLDVLVGLQALFGLEPVNVRHAFPHLVANLVAGEIEVRCGEQPSDLGEDASDEVIGLRVRRIEGAPVGIEELGIGSSGGAGMAGHLDLGHDHDVPVGGILDDLAECRPS